MLAIVELTPEAPLSAQPAAENWHEHDGEQLLQLAEALLPLLLEQLFLVVGAVRCVRGD